MRNAAAPLNDEQARYDEIMRFLNDLKPDCLLVFDGVDPGVDLTDILSLECRVIITTRGAYTEYENTMFIYRIDFLNLEACRELFARHSRKRLDQLNPTMLDEVLALAGRHTLAVELLGKTLYAAHMPLEELRQKLRSGGFNLEGLSETVNREGSGDDARLVDHLTKLYDIAGIRALDGDAEWLLANLSVLPLADGFPLHALKKLLGLENFNLLNKIIQYGWLAEKDDSVTMYAVLSEVLRRIFQPDEVRCEKMMHAVLSEITFDKQDPKVYQARSSPFLRCAESLLQYVADETELTGQLWHEIGNIRYWNGEYDPSRNAYEKAKIIREKVLGLEHPFTATTYNNIAGVYCAQGQYEKALFYYEKDRAISEKALGLEHPSTATTYNNIAGVYEDQGQYEKALFYYEKALAICEKALGLEHPSTATTYNNIALVYSEQGQYEKALFYYEKALAIREKALGLEHPDTAATYNNIAGVYYAQGQYEKAVFYYEKALAIREKALGLKHPDTATTYDIIAGVYRAQGQYEKALFYYEKALAIREKALGLEHPSTATTYNNIAGVYYNQGQYDQAVSYCEKALAIFERTFGPEHPSTRTVRGNYESLKESMQ